MAAKTNDQKLPTITMEGVKLLFRNFSGKKTDYNAEGQRNFCVLLPPDAAEQMAKDGYNIKFTRPRDEDDTADPYVQVKINYGGARPPRVVLITDRGRTELGEDELNILDWADIRNVDLILGPYRWKLREGTPREATGISCYLQSIYITIQEDKLEAKYGSVPQDHASAASGREWTPNEDDPNY